MIRCIVIGLTAVGLAMASAAARAQSDSGNTTYELMINGESFTVDGNRVVKLESKEKPGTSYEVAIRISPVQRVRLNAAQFEYDFNAKIADDRAKDVRNVQVIHQLGFIVTIIDLGQAVDPVEALKVMVERLEKKYQEQKVDDLKVGEAYDRKFEGAPARGVKIHYRDIRGVGHTCLAYVFTDAKFAVTCQVEFLDSDSVDALPMIKKTLDSIRAKE